jgi:hypothetical protein
MKKPDSILISGLFMTILCILPWPWSPPSARRRLVVRRTGLDILNDGVQRIGCGAFRAM